MGLYAGYGYDPVLGLIDLSEQGLGDSADLTINGALIASSGTTYLAGTGDVLFETETESADQMQRMKHNGFLSLGVDQYEWNDVTQVPPVILGNDIIVTAGGDVRGTGPLFFAENDLIISASGIVDFDASVVDRYFEQSGYNIVLSFPGSNILGAVVDGGSPDDALRAVFADSPVLGPLMAAGDAASNGGSGLTIASKIFQAVTQGVDVFAAGADGAAQLGTEGGLGAGWSAVGQAMLPGFIQGWNTTDGGIPYPTSVTLSFGTYEKTDRWEEGSISGLHAGGSTTIISEAGEINLIGGTQVFADQDIMLIATCDKGVTIEGLELD